MSQKIECPKCGHQISVDEAIIQRAVDLKVKNKLDEEKNKLEIELKKEFEKSQTASLKTLQEKLVIEEKKRREAELKELEFIKKQTDLEDKIRKQDLEIARKIQEERHLIIEKTQKESEEKFHLLNRELRKQLEDTKKALSDAQRKAQQGSMQTQGEVLELSLEEMLKQNFPHDKISAVPKGISGADIIQIVVHPSGQETGMIAWEVKRTKSWTEEWVQKLKDDSRQIKANISVLVSEVLPKNIANFGFYNGIWVCDYASILGLTTALRNQILAVFNTVTVNIGKEEKMEVLYNYLCSPTFSQRVETIVETFINMQRNLEKEKIAFNKIWAVRETQIKRLQDSTIKMYGEIQGIAGKSLPNIELLELESGLDEAENTRKKVSSKNTNPPAGGSEDQSSLFI
ncbi:MAG: DUF2130 domain-containing protein [Patescibacteria group bacterium]|nr:DUF2130 domain-containing protein [Patescibacteria group bacterium]